MSNELHDFVGSPEIVMPDLIRHPDPLLDSRSLIGVRDKLSRE
jgi:hypothetical protein